MKLATLRDGTRDGRLLVVRADGEFVLILDGDGQHDPEVIPALLRAARDARRTIIVGSRLDGPGAALGTRRNAIQVANFFASWTSGLALQDSQSGLRVYPIALFDEVRTLRGGFVFETESLLGAADRGRKNCQAE